MHILKKIAMLPVATLSAAGYLIHIYAMMLAGLLARDEKRVTIRVYIESQKLLAERLASNLE